MQAVGVGQDDTPRRPVHRQLAAKGFEHAAAGGGLAEFMPAPLDQQVAQALEGLPLRLATAGQAEQPGERLGVMLQRSFRGDESQSGAADALLAVQQPEAVAERQRWLAQQSGGESGTAAAGLLQQANTLPGQVVGILGGESQADQLAVQRQLLRRAAQQGDQRLGIRRIAQRLAEIALAEGAGEHLQQSQVFVGARGNGDGEVDALAIAPVDARGKLHQAHPGADHLVAGVRRTVGNRDALPEIRRALRFARLHARQIAGHHQAIRDQRVGQVAQRGLLVRCALLHLDVRGIQFEHVRVLYDGQCQTGRLLNRFIKGWHVTPEWVKL